MSHKTLLVLCLAVASAAGGCRRRENAGGPDGPPPGERIVSLAPNLTEIVCALGAASSLVGRSSACDYPAASLQDVPVVGDFGRPSLELLARAQPTLVLDADLADETTARQIEAMGIRRERIVCQRIEDIPGAIDRVGELLGRMAEAQALTGPMREKLEELRAAAEYPTQRPSVYVEIWNDPLTTVGKSSFVADVVTLAGGVNIGSETDKEYFQVSAEWVISRNPDVILCLYMSSSQAVRQQVLDRHGWRPVRAIARGRVYDELDPDIVLRPGPRVLEGIEQVREVLHRKP